MKQLIELQAIGIVRNSIKEMLAPEHIRQVPSRIIIEPGLRAGLEGLEAGQRILILFHLHRASGDFKLQQHPKRDLCQPKKGIFALRSPQRAEWHRRYNCGADEDRRQYPACTQS